MTRSAWCDGVRIEAPTAPLREPHLFETIGRFGVGLPLWPRHLRRLRESLAALGWFGEPPGGLRDAALALLDEHADDVVRVAAVRDGRRLRWLVTTRRRNAEAPPLPVCWASAPRPGGAAHHKRAPRDWLEAERQIARAAGAHDALVWRGELALEATAYNLWVAVDGELRTPPLDGGCLPGVARAVLLEGLATAGNPAVEAPVARAAVARGAVFLSNAVYGPRPAALAGAPASPPSPWAERLAAAWSRAVGC